MKNMFTLKQLVLFCFGLAAGVGLAQQAFAQVNWAPTATFDHDSPIAGVPPHSYGVYHYNDGLIAPYPAFGTSSGAQPDNFFAFVNSGGWIKIWWTFPNPVKDIDKIVFYKNDRPITSCTISHFSQATQQWIVDTVYNNFSNNYVDSIMLSPAIPIATLPVPIPPGTPVDTILISNIQSPLGNPSFREIQLWNLPACTGTPTAEIIAGSQIDDASAGPTNPVINACPGYTIWFGALGSNTDSGHNYQWQVNENGAGWVDVPGEHKPGFTYTVSGYNVDVRVVDDDPKWSRGPAHP